LRNFTRIPADPLAVPSVWGGARFDWYAFNSNFCQGRRGKDWAEIL